MQWLKLCQAQVQSGFVLPKVKSTNQKLDPLSKSKGNRLKVRSKAKSSDQKLD